MMTDDDNEGLLAMEAAMLIMMSAMATMGMAMALLLMMIVIMIDGDLLVAVM